MRKEHLHPIFRFKYTSRINPNLGDTAVIAADDERRAKSILEDYLQRHPLNSQRIPAAVLPKDYSETKKLDFVTNQLGVIYCSLDDARILS
ncbi:MAG TPA: hypothetical protein VMC80_02670 [Patescibacteria group bacterium]|nr:hypothetical protein [Patescibacteria group bacterium]